MGRISVPLLCCLIPLLGGCLPSWATLRRRALPSVPPAVQTTMISVEVPQPVRPARHVLALSGGGSYGAFTSGVLSGWSRSNNRPEFDVVTGISTGALIAPMAFLGPAYDYELKKFYTEVSAQDVFSIRSIVTIPFRESVARLGPLRSILEANLTPEVLAAIAAEHRKGRRLYVATTNLDSRKMVTWDIGAMACSGGENSAKLIHDVILASASVPGLFPPVPIEVEIDGKLRKENHVDGGVAAPLFVPAGLIESAPPGVQVYAIVAGKLYPSTDPVPTRVLKVIAASGVALMHSYTRSEVVGLARRTQVVGGDFHLSYLRQDFKATDNGVQFHTDEMNRFFVEGVKVGLGPANVGPGWSSLPHEAEAEEPSDIRTGARFRTSLVAPHLPPTNTPPAKLP